MSAALSVVLTTFDDRAVAEQISRTLVEEGLAACAQLETVPVLSTYRWKGKPAVEEEWRLMLKVDPERLPALRDRLLALHPYDVPQFVCLDATASAAYGAWVRGSGGGPS